MSCRRLTDVLVHELHRREGIGSELLRRLMAGRDEIHFVLRSEPQNHPLYLRLGFEPAPTMLRRRRKKKGPVGPENGGADPS